ncbi:MAG: hypothetical protein J07HQX50_02315 [Haloquadratum sp. J07HQX50]|nr:MAG: hypothetical protein J07HQX50_02315 [Haloquadratum sp. J07HQX50]
MNRTTDPTTIDINRINRIRSLNSVVKLLGLLTVTVVGIGVGVESLKSVLARAGVGVGVGVGSVITV